MRQRCGTRFGYRDHDRNGTDKCPPCTNAQRVWQADYEKRVYLNRGPLLVDATGTRRRLQALAVLGWPRRLLAERMGMACSYAGALMRKDRVQLSTAQKVAALYDELSMTLGPEIRSANAARRNGWLPPLAWDDDTIDDPAARPDRGPVVDVLDELAVGVVVEGSSLQLSGKTLHAAVHALTAAGLSAAVIAERLHIPQRQVNRLRSRETAPRPLRRQELAA